MTSLQLIAGTYRQQPIVKVTFPYNKDLIALIQTQDSGTASHYIQVLLGHNSSKTTELYTRVSVQEIGKIKNPLDDFYI